MSKFDIRGYRLLSWRYIYLTMILEIIGFTIFNLEVSGTVGLVAIPLMTYAFGWQMGCMSERNDWDKWDKNHVS